MTANTPEGADFPLFSVDNQKSDETIVVSDLQSLRKCAHQAVGGLAWPTIILSTVSLGAFFLFTGAALTGALPIWAATLLNIPCYFIAYTGFHEATHRNFHGHDKRFSWLNDIFGTTIGFIFFYPYTMHNYIHLTHHAHTNDSEKDPDHWMSGHTFFQIALRGLTLVYHYSAYTARMRKKQPGAARFYRRIALEAAPPLLTFAFLIATGHWQVALFAWVIPYVISVALLGVCFDWIVHHPHDDCSLLGGTRTFRARKGWRRNMLNWLHLFQNYHLIHHIYPRIPFYKQEAVFEQSEEFLRKQGARIVDL